MDTSDNGPEIMKTHYDPEVDILYIKLRKGPVHDSEELANDVRVEYNRDRKIIALEISNARRNIASVLAKSIAEQIPAS